MKTNRQIAINSRARLLIAQRAAPSFMRSTYDHMIKTLDYMLSMPDGADALWSAYGDGILLKVRALRYRNAG